MHNESSLKPGKMSDIHMNAQNRPDSELARRISCGDEQAFRKLFYKYYYPLYGFAQKFTQSEELARDCVQDVFLKIWKIRKKLCIDYSLKAYLYCTVRNRALNLLGQEETQNRLSREQEKELSSQNINIFEDGFNNSVEMHHIPERMQKIWELVENLPKQQRLVLELHRKDGLSYREIASVLNITRKTVENHMGRALMQLRKNLDEREFIEQ